MNLIAVRELYRPKASGWVAHNGLELVSADSTSQVFHNSPKTGPIICSYDEFTGQQQVTVKSESSQNLEVVRERIESLLAQRCSYDAKSFNCEHAVSLVLSGAAKSPQVKATINGGLFLGGLCLLFGGNAKQTAAAVVAGSTIGLAASKTYLLSTG